MEELSWQKELPATWIFGTYMSIMYITAPKINI